MSVETLALVLHHSRSKGTDKVILIGIANHDGDGGAWPSVATLAKYANVTERNVQAALRRLESLGEVVVHLKAGGPSGMPAFKRPNRYEVIVSCPITCDRTSRHRQIDLMAAPSDLWIKGVSPATPGDASDTGEVSPATPGEVSPATPEPYLEPNHNTGGVVNNSTTERARTFCAVCSREELDCRQRIATSGHEFTPSLLSVAR